MSFWQSIKPGKTFKSDAISGFSTGLFSIPEGMAYAQLAGVNPVYGLYSGMVATLVAALSTGTILMISTLTSAIALSIGSVLTTAGIDPDTDPAALFTVTLLVGIYMFVAGLLRYFLPNRPGQRKLHPGADGGNIVCIFKSYNLLHTLFVSNYPSSGTGNPTTSPSASGIKL